MNAINYDTLFQRVKKGVSYRQIAKEENVSVRCVTRMMRRHRESGSIYPVWNQFIYMTRLVKILHFASQSDCYEFFNYFPKIQLRK